MSLCDIHFLSTRTDTDRVNPVGFRVVLPDAVVFCASACAHFDRQLDCIQFPPERPTSGIDCRRVFEGLFGFNLDFGMSILSRRLIAFSDVAGIAGNRQIGDTVAAATRFRDDMLNFQWHIFYPTIGAFTPPFFEQVFAHFVAVEFALLVLHARYFWVLH